MSHYIYTLGCIVQVQYLVVTSIFVQILNLGIVPKIPIQMKIVFCAVVTIVGGAGEVFNKFNDFAAGRELLSMMINIFDDYVEVDPW